MEEPQIEEAKHHTTQQQRRYWMLMGLPPSAAIVIWFWIAANGGDPDGSIGSLCAFALPLWLLLCAVKLARLRCPENAAGAIGLTVLYFVLFLLINAVLGITLLWGSCMVTNYSPGRWH